MKKKLSKNFIKKFYKNKFGKIGVWVLGILLLLIFLYYIAAYSKKPEEIKYGVSFNVPYALELGLDWQEAYVSILDELEVKRIRLAAHWPLVEPSRDVYDFSYLDFQLNEARKRDVDVVLAIGRRVPRWPECHVPEWAKDLPDEQWQPELLQKIEAVVNRYKDYENIIYWQVENEPFLEVFAYEHCGDLDEDFLDEEIAFVRELDPDRPILMTDSGNLGRWTEVYSRADSFGTSVYLYFWNPYVGRFRTILPASFYRLKANLMELLHGQKETYLIELSLEPWLIQSLVKTPVETQLEMMDLERMKEILDYAKRTNLEHQYLWGVEWWYWLREKHDMPEIWEYVHDLVK